MRIPPLTYCFAYCLLGIGLAVPLSAEERPFVAPTNDISVISMLKHGGKTEFTFGAARPKDLNPRLGHPVLSTMLSMMLSMMLSKCVQAEKDVKWYTHAKDAKRVEDVSLHDVYYGFVEDRLALVWLDFRNFGVTSGQDIDHEAIYDGRALFLNMDLKRKARMISGEAYAYSNDDIEVITFGMCQMYEGTFGMLVRPVKGPVKGLPSIKGMNKERRDAARLWVLGQLNKGRSAIPAK